MRMKHIWSAPLLLLALAAAAGDGGPGTRVDGKAIAAGNTGKLALLRPHL